MDEISPSLAKLKHSAVYMPGQTHFSGKVVQHVSYSSDIDYDCIFGFYTLGEFQSSGPKGNWNEKPLSIIICNTRTNNV